MDQLLTLKEAAAFLQIHEKSLLKLLAEENVPARKVVGKWRFSKQALVEWIGNGQSSDYTKSSAAESEDELD